MRREVLDIASKGHGHGHGPEHEQGGDAQGERQGDGHVALPLQHVLPTQTQAAQVVHQVQPQVQQAHPQVQGHQIEQVQSIQLQVQPQVQPQVQSQVQAQVPPKKPQPYPVMIIDPPRPPAQLVPKPQVRIQEPEVQVCVSVVF